MKGRTRGKSQDELEAVDVSEVLDSEVNGLRSAYPDADITVDVDGPVLADAGELVYSVFGNILQNALQHTESRTPQIRVTAEVDDDTVVVTVGDDGPGLPDDVREQLVGRDLARPTTGTHIVRSLVELYDGDIAVETGETGTTITVSLQRSEG